MNARGALQLLEYQVQDDYALSPELEDAVAVLSAALDERGALLDAYKAIMRPDGHYVECPCTGNDSVWGQGHKHMPNNPTVAICKQLQAAIAAAKGEA